MTSRWIKECDDETIFSTSWGDAWVELLPILERINKLLERAMLDTDDEILYEDIRKELDSGAN
jgi:hypothetical protein